MELKTCNYFIITRKNYVQKLAVFEYFKHIADVMPTLL